MVVLEDSWESLGLQGDQLVNPEGNQSWIFIGRTDAEAETPILWSPDAKNGLIGKDPDAGKDWRREEKGTTEDEMVAWYHRLDGHKFEYAPGIGDGQGSLLCCSPWSCRVRHDWVTEQQDLLGCASQSFCPCNHPAARPKKEPRVNKDINVLLNREPYKTEAKVLEWQPWPMADCRQNTAAVFAVQGRRRLPTVGGMTLDDVPGYQGNYWKKESPTNFM